MIPGGIWWADWLVGAFANQNQKNLGKIREQVGVLICSIYRDALTKDPLYIRRRGVNSPNILLRVGCRPSIWCHSCPKYLLLPVKSHDNAVHTDEDGHRRAPRPTRQAGFIQAPAFIEPERSGARASRHPPRWHAQPDEPRDGTRAADRAVAAARSAVVLSGVWKPKRR